MDAINGLRRGSAISLTPEQSAASAARATLPEVVAQRRPSDDPPPQQPSGGQGVAQEVKLALRQLGVSLSGTGAAFSSIKAGEPVAGLHEALGEFMTQLADAAQAAGALDSTSTPPAQRDKSGFASGLNALVRQVGLGDPPPGLQSAYEQLLQRSGTQSAPSLQSFLTQLQSQLGYGVVSSTPAGSVGNLLDSRA
ncbi:MAG: hypothetical protein DI603_19460 [Roseateles depolymerans]|uniref:DUF5610 domain-containing protein n=1 Tax=Roseateles depolymerans TaxID=76731 RepID=A0A2W5DD68_9BURK|nr:MAG: hypothetical protein DI603_19460 [Roseateles depolymerans]